MSEAPRSTEPRILERSQHPISRKDISDDALRVLYRLHHAGFRAYLVGGGVRDLMLGRRPKDFDVATDARPNEVRRLFRNSRTIGRRFRLVHVFFKDGVVEVSTFRNIPEREEQDGGPEDLLITSDNSFGTPEQDAFRRDFTINALFYSVADFTLIDYVGGVDDLEARLVRVIGDPDVRFKEDPVRMLRACEFAARLGFGIEHGTQEAIERHRRDLEKASPARLTEELLQLMRCGACGRSFQWMLDLGLLEILLPEAYAVVDASTRGLGDFAGLLPAIDRHVHGGGKLSDAVVLSALLLPSVLLRRMDVEALNQRPMRRDQVDELVREVLAPFIARFALSRARSEELHHALVTFQHLGDDGFSDGQRLRLARRPSFAEALSLLELMVAATKTGTEVLARWREALHRAGTTRGREDEERPDRSRGKRARPRRRRRRAQ